MLSNQKQTIRSDRETVAKCAQPVEESRSQWFTPSSRWCAPSSPRFDPPPSCRCLQLVEELRRRISTHMGASQSITDQLRRILTPVQVAKFLMWVERNKRSMDLLNTLQGDTPSA